MNSKDAMREACKDVGIREIAEVLEMSPSNFYNQINDPNRKDLLSKFVDFCNACENDKAIAWASEELNGTFVKNPDISHPKLQDPNECISTSLKEFGDIVREINLAAKDQKISKEETASIRKEWEELKVVMESFVLSHETL